MFRLQFLLVSLFLLCCDARRRPRHMPVTVFGRPFGGFLDHPNVHKFASAAVVNDNVKSGTVTQPLDHFNPNDSRTWEQHYMYNMQFYNGSGLIFCMVGGESKISYAWIADTTYMWLVWAKKFQAATFQPEHRFYGDSHPMPDMSTASYQYFTIEQALADLRNFILQMNQKFFAGVKTRWVLFGGSYPGSLSAWFRSKNSDITIGSISSSAGMHTQLDYFQYAENVEWVLNLTSPSCAENVRKGINEVFELVYTVTGRQQLEKVFDLCEPFPLDVMPKDIQYFMSNIFGTFQSIAQYSGDNRDAARRDGLGIPRTCDIMNNASEPSMMRRLKAVMDFYNSFFEPAGTCNDNSYASYIEMMMNVTYDPPDYDRSSARGWMWQCCTQLGFMQTTDGGRSIFGSSVPLDFYIDQCMDMFGNQYDADFTRKGADLIHKMLGGATTFVASKVVLPNGANDPWKSAGYYKNDTANAVYAFLIKGGAHCSDMYPASDHDSAALKNARAFIEEQLSAMIG